MAQCEEGFLSAAQGSMVPDETKLEAASAVDT